MSMSPRLMRPKARAAVGPPPPPNLIDRWKFDEASGATTSNAANNNSATLGSGASRVAGIAPLAVNPKALLFDGTNGTSGATDAALVSGADPRTVAFWVKVVPPIATKVGVFFKYGTAGGGSQLSVGISDGSQPGAFGEAGSVFINYGNALVFTTGINIADSAVHHIAVTYDGTTFAIFVDGVQQADSGGTVSINTTLSGNLFFGVDDASTDYLYAGTLDDWLIYSRVLTGAEITFLAGGGSPQ